MESESFDCIVIGAGAAGGTLAARLSENPGLRVLVLEGGGSHRDLRIDMPAGWGQILHDPKYSWCFETEPEPHAGGRRIALPRGKLLGGSSSINGMLYVRGRRARRACLEDAPASSVPPGPLRRHGYVRRSPDERPSMTAGLPCRGARRS